MRSMQRRNVLVVLYDGVQSLDVTGPLEVFSGATRYALETGAENVGYDLRTATLTGDPVRTSSGLTLAPDGDLWSWQRPVDTLVVPGGLGSRHVDPGIVDWLRRRAPEARRVV